MLLAYSRHFDINLWFRPTPDSPKIERIKKIGMLCKAITVFSPESLVNNAEIRSLFNNAVKSSQCIHINRQIWLMGIQHRCIFWDIDELPIELRESSRNLHIKPIPSEVIKDAISRYSQAWRNARRVFSSSHLEANKAIGNSYYMPNVYSASRIQRKKIKSRNIIFVGNMNFYPNIDAILYFSENILPLLPKSVNFMIVGRGPLDAGIKDRFSRLTKNNSQIKIFSDVESCAPFYLESCVAVAPLRFGGGTKLKILEAFGQLCPVVSTAKGCEGLEVRDGMEVLLRDAPAEFASACLTIIQNPEIGDALANNSYDLLASKYSQNNLNELLDSCLREEGVL